MVDKYSNCGFLDNSRSEIYEHHYLIKSKNSKHREYNQHNSWGSIFMGPISLAKWVEENEHSDILTRTPKTGILNEVNSENPKYMLSISYVNTLLNKMFWHHDPTLL